MKKLQLLSLAALSLSCAIGITPSYAEESKECCSEMQDLCVINVSDLTESDIDQTIQGSCPHVAIQFSAGTELPLSVFLKGDLLSFTQSEDQLAQVKVEKTFYVRVAEDNLLLSTDLATWVPFAEFITGNVNMQLLVQNHQPAIVCEAEINHKR